LYINDVSDNVALNVLLSAEDTVIYIKYNLAMTSIQLKKLEARE